MIHLAQASLFTLAPVALGIITIFGRKGKKDVKDEEKNEKAPAEQQPAAQPSRQSPGTPPAQFSGVPPSDTGLQSTSDSATHPEETSLNALLRSLLQDVPLDAAPTDDANDPSNKSTPEWVPPLSAPRSRAMVIGREEGEDSLAESQSERSSFPNNPPRPTQDPNRSVTLQSQTARPMPPPAQKTTRPEPETSKPSKPEKFEKPETKQPAAPPARKTQLGFEHLFDLTKGGLESPGLVLVVGQHGTGKTSLALNLAGKYLSSGNDCILVCYDQPIPSFRDTIKSTGWEAGKYESEFHLMIFDAFSGQTDSFSTEPYYIEKPFDLDNLTETLARNLQMMMNSKIKVIVDSITALSSKNTGKEFLAKFRGLSDKMKELGATFIVTLDTSALSKEAVSELEDMAVCEIELEKDGENAGQLKVKKLDGAASKLEPEEFEIQQGKGLLFT